ncbi:hypothetical protein DOE76_18395 [Leifsonia sp. ku-ls]|nr:hypothetical protein DOE76_18395 [Leifsonia sp. ku-ls]
MGQGGTDSRWLRLAVGRPRVRSGVAWLAIAAAWLVVTIADGTNPWGYLIAGLWALTGTAMLTVAVRDLRYGRGAYAPPAVGDDG